MGRGEGKSGGIPRSLRIALPLALAIAVATAAANGAEGPAVGWGSDAYGLAPIPDPVSGVLGETQAIDAGAAHDCAIQFETNHVLCWGDDFWGQASAPDEVNGQIGTASAIAAGSEHSCAIRTETGVATCWGRDQFGEGTPPETIPPDPSELGDVLQDPIDFRPVALCAGRFFSCGIQELSNAVICWGALDTPLIDVPDPEGDPELEEDPDASTVAYVAAQQIACGTDHACAIEAQSKAVTCWGDDSDGESSPPLSVDAAFGGASAIDAGENFSCAIRSEDDSVVCWGNDHEGKASPPATVNGLLGTATAVATGSWHACAIESLASETVCWGTDYFGETVPPTSGGAPYTALAITAGKYHSLAVAIPEPGGALAQATASLLASALAARRRRTATRRAGRCGP